MISLVLHEHAEVTLACSGAEALAALKADGFDAVTVDISLPDISGLEVIAQGRLLAPKAGIVAITGFVDVDVAVSSMKAGADDFFAKPFKPELLWHVLTKAANNRRRQLEAEQAGVYRTLAYTDALTGAPNRRFLDEFVAESVSSSVRDGHPLTVAYLDVDNFKLLNDIVGHEQGDTVLRQVATLLTSSVRQPAVFGRFGGDEFVAVFPGFRAAEARAALSAVTRKIGELSIVNRAGVALPTRLSIGVSEFRGTETARELITDAEDQMYLDKSAAHAAFGAAMEHADQEAILKVTNLKALRNLVKAIDRRDSYTRFHSDHATRLAITLGRRVGAPDDILRGITIGGPIHDLGKIVIPDEILRKPGILTPAERRAMEEHPVVGAAITAAVTDYDAVVQLVRHHHERFDGDGYPGRLRGEEISLATRIFTLADAFSAMTTDRTYRRGLSVERALAEIMQNRGTQFDPDLAALFCDIIAAPAEEAAA
jgi:diguanylate cyclase (GGDEF)-like protein